MTMHTSPRSYHGVAAVRADASDANKILGDLQTAVKAMRDKHDEALKAKVDDVVLREHVDRINTDVGNIQAALDAANAKISAMSVNGVGGGKKVADAEYTNAFSAHFRKGEVQASLNKGATSEGGYLAPVEWDRSITDKLVIVSPMRSICSVQSISTNGFSKLFNQRGTASGWVAEAAARAGTATPAFGSVNYTTGELYARPNATQQMLDDAAIDLEAWLAGQVEDEFAYQEGIAFVSGNGTDKPNGILTYVTGGANAAAHPFGAIATVNSGHASQVTADGIMNLVYALPSSLTGGASFIMNRNTQKAVRLLKDGQNNYLWQPSYVAGQPATVAGYGLTEVAAMPDIAAGTKPILFGDFKRGYLIVDRMGVRVLRDPFTNKPYVEFYTTKRVGGGLLNPEVLKAMNISV